MLQQNVSFKGLNIVGNYKITSLSYCECWARAEDGTKIYNLTVSVEGYTDEAKEFEFERDSYNFQTSLEGLTIGNGYLLLKTLPKYEGSLDI